MKCTKCPRHCPAKPGFCNTDSSHPEVAGIYAHKGEEPPISGAKGITNIFFAHCNMQCTFCQNHEISGALVDHAAIRLHSVEEIVDGTVACLEQTENIVGLVSATQYSDLVAPIVEGLHKRGRYPTVVYNTNGYESVEVLRDIAPYIDVWLPDFKYSDPTLAWRYSHARDYPEVARMALAEMFRQMGSMLATDEHEVAFRGLIIRHLVLPGQTSNSVECLRWIAENLSVNVHISLMSQYCPPVGVELPEELNRKVTEEEYQEVVGTFYELGFRKGWVQQLDSADNYQPDFRNMTFGTNPKIRLS